MGEATTGLTGLAIGTLAGVLIGKSSQQSPSPIPSHQRVANAIRITTNMYLPAIAMMCVSAGTGGNGPDATPPDWSPISGWLFTVSGRMGNGLLEVNTPILFVSMITPTNYPLVPSDSQYPVIVYLSSLSELSLTVYINGIPHSVAGNQSAFTVDNF